MGKLRIVPNEKEPGFHSFRVAGPPPITKEKPSHLTLRSPGGVCVEVSRDMSLRQIARLVKMLEGGRGLG